ncbi:MAG: L-lactate dehydrogenase [Thermotogota bacterium]
MKITMIGAGKVGSTTMYSILEKGIASELAFIDINTELAEGEAMDIMHSTPFYRRTKIRAGSFELLKKSDIVIISAGAAQKEGETRLELSEKNAKIMKNLSKKINEYCENPIILVLTNPVDIMTAVVQKETGLKKNRVFGSGTVLDTMRLRSLISTNCSISASNAHVYIIGEHGDSEVAVWSQAKIGGIPISAYSQECTTPDKCETCLEGLFEQTKNAAYEIINKKGATNFAIASATAHIAETIIKNEKRILTLSSPFQDIYIGYPSVLGKNGIERSINLSLSEEEKTHFFHSVDIIRNQTKRVIQVL